MIDCIASILWGVCLFSLERENASVLSLQTLALAEWVLLALESHPLKRCLSSPKRGWAKDPRYITVPHTRRGLHGAGVVISRDWLFVDLVNTVSRDNVRSRSNQNPVDGRYNMFQFDDVDNDGVLQRYNSHTTAGCALLLLCIQVHQNCLMICMPWRKQATLVLNEGGVDWSPWNVGEWE